MFVFPPSLFLHILSCVPHSLSLLHFVSYLLSHAEVYECEHCQEKDKASRFIVCDTRGCDNWAHLSCMQPPLPDDFDFDNDKWYCATCTEKREAKANKGGRGAARGGRASTGRAGRGRRAASSSASGDEVVEAVVVETNQTDHESANEQAANQDPPISPNQHEAALAMIGGGEAEPVEAALAQ